MADPQQNFQDNSYFNDVNSRIRGLEERQRMLKDRLLLIGQNLIESREEHKAEILELRKSMEIMNRSVSRLISFIESASQEFGKFAKKEDLEILSKQARMFQPLNISKNK